MGEVTAYLGLGSNMGDRRENIDGAIALLDALEGCCVEAVSSVIESKPQGAWDGEPGNDFLNCCVRIRTSLAPLDLLRAVKGIERGMGRDVHEFAAGSAGITETCQVQHAEKYLDASFQLPGEMPRLYRDRPIDIDILLYGDIRLDTPELQIPHPRMQEREWVMGPLREIQR